MAEKKSNFLGFRLAEEELKKLKRIAQYEDKTPGKVAKEAVKQWLNLESFAQATNMVIISKQFFIKLLSFVDEKSLDAIAEEMADLTADIVKYMLIKPLNREAIEDFIIFTPKFLGKSGLRWFDVIEIFFENNHVYLKGLHNMGKDFSVFFACMSKYLIDKYFEFELNEDTMDLTSKLIFLEFNPKKPK